MLTLWWRAPPLRIRARSAGLGFPGRAYSSGSMSGPIVTPPRWSRAGEHVFRLVLRAAAVAFLWIAVDHLLSLQQHASESFQLDAWRWGLALGAAIGAGLVAGVASSLPLRPGYRPIRTAVLGLPPAVFMAQFVFQIWWVFPRHWLHTPWFVDWPHLFFSPAAQLALAVLFGLALAGGFRTRRDAPAEAPAPAPGVAPTSDTRSDHGPWQPVAAG